jgi:predicted glutamine amidotransferase
MQGAQKLRSEAYLHVRCNDEVEAQRSRWTFYETIKIGFAMCRMLGLKNFEYGRHKGILENFLALADTGNVLPGDGPGHRDGWGIGYYKNGQAVVHKSGGSAVEEKSEFWETCASIGRSRIILVHLRKSAWHGTSTANHAHPFCHEGILFAHNGTIRDYKTLRKEISEQKKPYPEALDSEVYFRYVMNFSSLGLKKGFQKAVQHIRKYNSYSSLTCLFSDGNRLYGYREYRKNPEYYSLYYATFEDSVVISSQPLSPRLQWKMMDKARLSDF